MMPVGSRSPSPIPAPFPEQAKGHGTGPKQGLGEQRTRITKAADLPGTIGFHARVTLNPKLQNPKAQTLTQNPLPLVTHPIEAL